MNSPGRWRKVYQRLWLSPVFNGLDDATRLTVLYLLTGPQSNRIGLFRLSAAAAAEDLGTFPETFRERLDNICRRFDWEFDSVAKVLWIPSWWRWNQPENPNVLIGNLKDLAEVPQSPLCARFAAHTEDLPPALAKTLQKTFGQTSPEPSPNQEQEQEQKSEQDLSDAGASEAGSREADDRRFEEFWAAYPKHLAKEPARKAFPKVCRDDIQHRKILAALEHQKNSAAWRKNAGEFIPQAATWLNQRRFEDEIEPACAGASHGRAIPDAAATSAYIDQLKAEEAAIDAERQQRCVS